MAVPADAMAVHVLIVNFNSAHLLGLCLDSLAGEGVSTISVLDNGSRPEERPRLQTLRRRNPKVMWLLGEENLGFGGGVNLLLSELAVGEDEVIWVLNPDTRVVPGCVAELRETLSEHRNSLVSPVITTQHGDQVWFAGGNLDLRNGASYPVRSRPLEKTTSWPFLTAAAIAGRSETWRTLGGFRSDLFLYWEDVDLSIRAERLGISLLVARDAEVMHLVGGSGRDVADQSEAQKSATWYYHMHRNRLIVCRSGLWRRAELVAVTGLPGTLRLLARAMRESTGRSVKLRASVLGVLHGLTQKHQPPQPTAGARPHRWPIS